VKVLVCGGREWADPWPILRELRRLPLESTIIHGDARGADRLGGEIAMGLGFSEVLAVPANWDKHHRAAGPIRNKRMLDMGLDLVLAFHENIDASKGTKHMVDIARRAGVKVKVFDA